MSKKCDNILLTLYLIIALLSLNKYISDTNIDLINLIDLIDADVDINV